MAAASQSPLRADAFLVVECDIPEGMTIREWRSACAAERRAATAERRQRRGHLRRVLGRR